MFQHTIQISQLTPDQFGELVETRSYQGMKRALAEYTPPAPDGSNLPELLTRKQTSEHIGVSFTTLNEWSKDTDERPAVLVPLKINGRVRYRRADVMAAFRESRRFKKQKAGEGHAR
ncbi:DNA-binding protein [Spirosoma areae]